MAAKFVRSQSAMEYLMTYGWTILIIAVVLGVLFQMGVFSSSTFTPRAQAGSCKVFRPGGPGTSLNLNLVGTCSGQLPQYMALFNGQNSNVITGNLNGLPAISSSGTAAITITAWGYSSDINSYRWIVGYGTGFPTLGLSYDSFCGSPYVLSIMYLTGSLYYDYCLPPAITAGKVIFYAVTYNGISAITYEGANGKLYSSVPNTYPLGTNVIAANPPITIGSGVANKWYGGISNVQVYNTSLDVNQLQALYMEGIGGAPVLPQYMVGWWPLNGDTNDYSGNNNNGAPTNIIYLSTWTPNYTPP